LFGVGDGSHFCFVPPILMNLKRTRMVPSLCVRRGGFWRDCWACGGADGGLVRVALGPFVLAVCFHLFDVLFSTPTCFFFYSLGFLSCFFFSFSFSCLLSFFSFPTYTSAPPPNTFFILRWCCYGVCGGDCFFWQGFGVCLVGAWVGFFGWGGLGCVGCCTAFPEVFVSAPGGGRFVGVVVWCVAQWGVDPGPCLRRSSLFTVLGWPAGSVEEGP